MCSLPGRKRLRLLPRYQNALVWYWTLAAEKQERLTPQLVAHLAVDAV